MAIGCAACQLGRDVTNFIHPTSTVEDGVVFGDNNHIGPYCYIRSGVKIGDDNLFAGYVSIGLQAQKRGFFDEEPKFKAVIGSSNILREFVTVHSGTRRPTVMGSRCIMLNGSHLSHDTIFEDDVTIASAVMIGGESHVMVGANLGLGAVLHQFCVVGSYSMVGMAAVCTKTLRMAPGGVYVGNPARYLKQNTIGLKRAGIDEGKIDLEAETRRWEKLLGPGR